MFRDTSMFQVTRQSLTERIHRGVQCYLENATVHGMAYIRMADSMFLKVVLKFKEQLGK